MPDVSDAALPWVLSIAALVATAIGAALGVLADRQLRHFRDWLAGRLSGLPILVARYGCEDCSVEDGEPHRYAGCPGNVRQHEQRLGLGGDDR